MQSLRRLIVLAAWAVTACGSDSSSTCVGSSEGALHSAESDPKSIDLGRAERASIVTVVAEGTIGPDFCTGTVIGKHVVLTAAHCESLGRMEVLVGENMTRAETARVGVRRSEKHPSLDLMLLDVDATDSLTAIQPIPVLETDAEPPHSGTLVELAGFGETETGASGKLGFVSEPVVSVNESTIVVDGAGRSGACSGDSGGPLFYSTSKSAVRVAGVLSEGSPDCMGIDVYVRPDAAWLAASGFLSAPSCEEP